MSQAVDLADANRILYDQGVLDAFGHVSVRSAVAPDRFLLSRNLAPALVTEHDILEFDLEATPSSTEKVYLERFIHSEIYRARPDVCAIVHSHSPAVVPFTVVESPMKPILHTAGFLAMGVSRFDVADAPGNPTNMLVDSPSSGAALASALGESVVVLMRGHGFVAVGDSLKQGVFRAVYTQVNARAQAVALQLGDISYLTSDEGRAASSANDGQLERVWSLWRSTARANTDRVTASPTIADQ